MKSFFKQLIPPIFLKFLIPKDKYGFFNQYDSWQEALKHSDGYNAEVIVEKVANSLLKVKQGLAAYERDSVLFDKIQYSWPVLAALLWIASKKENNLNIVDFGGSLGSTYFQNKNFLSHIKNLRWNVVEQENFVKKGKELFEDENLKFFYTLQEVTSEFKEAPHACLLSSSIQYVEKPYDVLESISKANIEYIIFDRTSFVQTKNNPSLLDAETVTVQKVRPRIYDASYPCHVLSKNKLVMFLKTRNYQLVEDFESRSDMNISGSPIKIEFKGMIFKKK